MRERQENLSKMFWMWMCNRAEKQKSMKTYNQGKKYTQPDDLDAAVNDNSPSVPHWDYLEIP